MYFTVTPQAWQNPRAVHVLRVKHDGLVIFTSGAICVHVIHALAVLHNMVACTFGTMMRKVLRIDGVSLKRACVRLAEMKCGRLQAS